MKRLLQFGFVLGLVGTLAVAYFAPWFEYTRYRSLTSVVPNGGRVEQFVVRLPQDKIEAADQAEGALSASASEIRMHHFKLRDTEGNVIGLAAKHELTIGDRLETAWLLTIPSRGTIALSATSPDTRSIESVVADLGLQPGDNSGQAQSIDFGNPATSVTSTGEFSDIDFELVETWIVTGVDVGGEIRGTLHLNTVGTRST